MQLMIVDTEAQTACPSDVIGPLDAADYVYQIAGEIAAVARAGGLPIVAKALELARDLAGEKLQSVTKPAPARDA